MNNQLLVASACLVLTGTTVHGDDDPVSFSDLEPAQKEAVYKAAGKKYVEDKPVPRSILSDIVDNDGEVDHFVLEAYMQSRAPEDEPFMVGGVPLRVRKSFEDISLSTNIKQTFEGAEFSYSRDISGRNDEWTARGAVFVGIPLDDNPVDETSDAWTSGASMLILGVEMDRFTGTSGEDDETNKLDFRVGYDLQYVAPKDVWRLSFRPSIGYTTDFDGEASIAIARFDFEPYYRPDNLNFGLFTSIPVSLSDDANAEGTPPSLWYQLRTTLRVETGYIFDAGDNTRLESDDAVLRLGPKLGLQLGFDDMNPFLDNLSFSLDYTYLGSILGEPGDSTRFEAAINYAITDEAGFKISYEEGDVSLVQQDTERFKAGFTFKF